MKANYNRKVKVREKAVAFRTKEAVFCLVQSTLYKKMENDKDIVYLDFENDEQIDKLINTLHELKKRTHEKEEEKNSESKTES